MAPIAPTSADIPLYSTLTGEALNTADMGPEYWFRAERETVRFADAVRGLLVQGYRSFIEGSPHPVLTVGVQDTIEDLLGATARVAVVGSLRREQGDSERLAIALTEAAAGGVDVDLDGAGRRRRRWR